jgi:hypothetical protein
MQMSGLKSALKMSNSNGLPSRSKCKAAVTEAPSASENTTSEALEPNFLDASSASFSKSRRLPIPPSAIGIALIRVTSTLILNAGEARSSSHPIKRAVSAESLFNWVYSSDIECAILESKCCVLKSLSAYFDYGVERFPGHDLRGCTFEMRLDCRLNC